MSTLSPSPSAGPPAPRSGPLGARLPRLEDARLLRGAARFLDDIEPAGTLHLAVVRSPLAHGRIVAVRGADVSAADLPPSLGQLPVLYKPAGTLGPTYPVLPAERAIYAGQPLAACLAASRYEAEDRAEAAEVDLEPLEAVVDVERALDGGPLLHPDWGGNIANRLHVMHGDVEAAFARAAGRLSLRLRFGRSQGTPMEGYGVLAQWDADEGRLTVWSSTQAPHAYRTEMARILGLDEWRLHVVTPDVGGGFGNKLHLMPEDVLACWLAMREGRPVKWVQDRREYLQAYIHSREELQSIDVAYAADGRLLGLRARVLCDIGAHLHTKGNGPGFLTGRMLPGPYRIEHAEVEVLSVVTNKAPQGAYRGFGQPEATFAIERALDAVARATGLEFAEVRRRNLLRPEELPWTTATGMHLDSGDYPEALRRCLEAADLAEFRERQARARAAGRCIGVGVGCYVEATGFGPSRVLERMGQNQGGYETAVVRIDLTGRVTVHTGLVSQGQGHRTVLAQVAAEVLGVPVETVQVLSGDTDRDPYSGYGTAGSRGAVTGGASTLLAAGKLRDKVLLIAAELLEARPDDLELAGGEVRVRGAAGRSVSLARVAHAAYSTHGLPAGMEPGLEAKHVYDPPDWTYSYAASVAEVEVDPETYQVRLTRYVLVHDCGTVLNPLLAEGQIVGGLAQGIGGALLEEHVYDDSGQLLTASFKDYLLPTVADVPPIELHHMETPSPFTPGGIKGLGEGGCVAAAPVIAQAIEDALGIEGLAELPITPSRLRRAVRAAAARAGAGGESGGAAQGASGRGEIAQPGLEGAEKG